jgi:hypothetical protein
VILLSRFQLLTHYCWKYTDQLEYYKFMYEETVKLLNVPREELQTHLKTSPPPTTTSIHSNSIDHIATPTKHRKRSMARVHRTESLLKEQIQAMNLQEEQRSEAESKQPQTPKQSIVSFAEPTPVEAPVVVQQTPPINIPSSPSQNVTSDNEEALQERKSSFKITTRTKSLFRPQPPSRPESPVTTYSQVVSSSPSERRYNQHRTNTIRIEDAHVWAEELKKLEKVDSPRTPPPPPPRNREHLKPPREDVSVQIPNPLTSHQDEIIAFLIHEFNEGCINQVRANTSNTSTSTNTTPSSACTPTQQTHSGLAPSLHHILSGSEISDMSSQSDVDTDDTTSTMVNSDDLTYDKDLYDQYLKPISTLQECIRLFNQDKPDACFQLLSSELFKLDDKLIAIFLANIGLNKVVLGTFLGTEKNHSILKEYCDYVIAHYFTDCTFEYALRNFFVLFKMPLEGQQVTRIAEEFSNSFIKVCIVVSQCIAVY